MTDLKAWDPDLNQTCPPTEFSLQKNASVPQASAAPAGALALQQTAKAPALCGSYDPTQFCCIKGLKYPKNSVSNLADPYCQKRVQVAKATADGCSVPDSVVNVVFPKFEFYTRDNPASQYSATSFRGTCDKHDKCYGDCTWKSATKPAKNDAGYKKNCDSDFNQNMLSVCQKTFNSKDKLCGYLKGRKREYNLCISGFKEAVNKCRSAAEIYYGVVSGNSKYGAHDFGKSHYEAAQKELCTCCPKK